MPTVAAFSDHPPCREPSQHK